MPNPPRFPGRPGAWVLYKDNQLIAFNNPAGLPAVPDRKGSPNLLQIAAAYTRHDLYPIHRLDRPVSGVLVLARTSKAAGRLSDQFRRRQPDKRYLAVVEGLLRGDGLATDWLVKGDTGTVRRVSEATAGAKEARLRWRALASDGRRTLVEVELLTGRAHQIRVQLAGLRAPIVGDLRYGASGPLGDGRGIALHAASLTVEHPTLRESMTWTAAPPARWRGLLDDAVAAAMDELGTEVSDGPARRSRA